MSRDKKEVLEIVCDTCGDRIIANPQISKSGWMQYGTDNGIGTDKVVTHYCPDCWSRRR